MNYLYQSKPTALDKFWEAMAGVVALAVIVGACFLTNPWGAQCLQ